MSAFDDDDDEYEACFDDAATTGWPGDDLFDALDARIEEIAGHPDVEMFYLGRGVDLADRKSKHEAEDIIPLYETDSVDNVMSVEEEMIDRWIDHDKCDNDANDARGGVSETYVNYFYVAIWWADDED